jgi:hypothetical protein
MMQQVDRKSVVTLIPHFFKIEIYEFQTDIHTLLSLQNVNVHLCTITQSNTIARLKKKINNVNYVTLTLYD